MIDGGCRRGYPVATMGIKSLSQLSMLMNKLQSIRDVLDVRREATA